MRRGHIAQLFSSEAASFMSQLRKWPRLAKPTTSQCFVLQNTSRAGHVSRALLLAFLQIPEHHNFPLNRPGAPEVWRSNVTAELSMARDPICQKQSFLGPPWLQAASLLEMGGVPAQARA